ncbi:MAG: 50S ribosomal protein L9 [Lentisphaerae bacterium]|jgi:large subunit ribosomal protein L9|nr:50S ribosomal protein L9 [Lentisphaerota bacterium]
MAIEVLLMSDVDNLGKAGDVVKVAPGYARNYLLPKELAAPVTTASLRRLDKLRKEREELARIQKAEANAKAAKLKGVTITIAARTTDGHKLYGSVTAADVLAKIGELGIELDLSQVVLAEPFKEVGSAKVAIKLHAEVSVDISVDVVEG